MSSTISGRHLSIIYGVGRSNHAHPGSRRSPFILFRPVLYILYTTRPAASWEAANCKLGLPGFYMSWEGSWELGELSLGAGHLGIVGRLDFYYGFKNFFPQHRFGTQFRHRFYGALVYNILYTKNFHIQNKI